MSSVCAKRTSERCSGMKRKPNPELIDSDNPELTDADFKRARPAKETLTELLGAEAAEQATRPRGRPRKTNTKLPLHIRLSPEVVAHFKATGRGWQTRIDEALKEWIEKREHRQSVAEERL